MIIDEYFDLTGMELMPFVDPDDETKCVNRLRYSLSMEEKKYLDLWIHSEKDGYYLYISKYEREGNPFGVSFFDVETKKVLLSYKIGRGARRSYFWAGMKAALFGKDIVCEAFPDDVIEWNKVGKYEYGMSKVPLHMKYFSEVKNIWYNFDYSVLENKIA